MCIMGPYYVQSTFLSFATCHNVVPSLKTNLECCLNCFINVGEIFESPVGLFSQSTTDFYKASPSQAEVPAYRATLSHSAPPD